VQRNAKIPTEWFGRLVRDGHIPYEWMLGVASRDAHITYEWLSGVARHAVIPDEWLAAIATFVRDEHIPFESSGIDPDSLLLIWNVLNKYSATLALQWVVAIATLPTLQLQWTVLQTLLPLTLHWNIVPNVEQQFVNNDVHRPTSTQTKTP
jgi:hypothetical protein